MINDVEPLLKAAYTALAEELDDPETRRDPEYWKRLNDSADDLFYLISYLEGRRYA